MIMTPRPDEKKKTTCAAAAAAAAAGCLLGWSRLTQTFYGFFPSISFLFGFLVHPGRENLMAKETSLSVLYIFYK
jgi:hypothetical protein